jgi:hypothetical protein
MITTRKCTQSTDVRCTSDRLYDMVVGSGIKAAYCNEDFVVVHSDLSGSYPMWLSDIPNPPGGGEDHDRTDQSDTGIFCQTGAESIYEEYGVYKFPLFPSPLATDDYTNNLNLASFPNGCNRNNPGSHMCERAGAGHDWGHPVRGPVGITITGQEIFPAFNNIGYLEPEKCTVDSCNQHVGAGGGQTHLHGDPYGAWCLYDVDNYTSSTVHHPPQIGWIFDGYDTYGRYISTTSLGFDTPLDGCGGHEHDDLPYHYHSALIEAVTDKGRYNPPTPTYDDFIHEGMPYLASTTGPYMCLKGDIGTIVNYWSNWRGEQKVQSNIYIVPDPTMDLCLNSEHYYVYGTYKLPVHRSMGDFEEFRAALDDETKAMIAANDEYDQMLIQYAAETGKPLLAVEDWLRTTSTYEGEDKMTIAEAVMKAAVPAYSAVQAGKTVTVQATEMGSVTVTDERVKEGSTDATVAKTETKTEEKTEVKEVKTDAKEAKTEAKTLDVSKAGKEAADANAPEGAETPVEVKAVEEVKESKEEVKEEAVAAKTEVVKGSKLSTDATASLKAVDASSSTESKKSVTVTALKTKPSEA